MKQSTVYTKLNTKLHSLSDWDFLMKEDWAPFPRFDLYPTLHVSPPTSLRFDPWIWHHEQYALCKHPLTLDLKSGRLLTYSRTQSGGVGESYLYIGVTGPAENCIRIRIQKMYGAWWHARFDWWQGIGTDYWPCTIVEEYRKINGDWSLYDTYYHPPMTGSLNRCGIGCTNQSLSADKYFDDTRIFSRSVK